MAPPRPHRDVQLHATLLGVDAALETFGRLRYHDDTAALVVRVGDSDAAAALAGTFVPHGYRSLLDRVHASLRRARGFRHVWIAGFDLLVRFPWGERASALAAYGAGYGFFGDLPPSYALAQPTAPPVPPWADEADCPVCYETYTDVWPSPDGMSRARPGWACQGRKHAICRDCDRELQNRANTKCPLCRAARSFYMQP